MTVRHPFVIVGVMAFLCAGVLEAEPQGWTMPAPTNLKVFDKGTPPREIMNAMKSFTSGLGVRCQFCHVYSGNDPNDLNAFNFASDEKPQKTTARAMMRVASDINAALAKSLGPPATPSEPRVSCYTCHRGDKQPLAQRPAPAASPAPPH